MTTSDPDRPVVSGDPASLSQSGGALRSLASALASAAAQLASAGDDLEGAWTGRPARAVGRRRHALADATRATWETLDLAGSLLQAHATDLAEAVQELRALPCPAEEPSELKRLQVVLARRRARLAAALEDARKVLAEQESALRR